MKSLAFALAPCYTELAAEVEVCCAVEHAARLFRKVKVAR